MALQSSHTALDDHTQLKDSPKLGLKALTGCCDHSDISVDSNLINSLTRTLSVHSAAADCVLHRSNSSSSCSGNISSSDGALDIDPVLPWAPDTPPGTPGKLLQSISVDGSTSSSGISSPRAVTAVAADPQLQADLQSLAAASVAATPDITFGLSDHARTAFRGKRVLLIVSPLSMGVAFIHVKACKSQLYCNGIVLSMQQSVSRCVQVEHGAYLHGKTWCMQQSVR